MTSLLAGPDVEPHPERQLPGLKRDHTGAGIDPLAQDLLRLLGGDFLDVHAARRAADDHRAGRSAIDDDAQIELALDLQSFFDQHAADLAPLRSGLMRDERHPEHLLGQLLGLVGRFRELDAAALAAPAGMNLRLDDSDAAAKTPGNLAGFLRRERYFAARNGHTEARQH